MDTQHRIVHKAHDLFMRYGIRSISMDEIASQLGMSKKTIYQFYADKDAVVEAVMQLEIENDCVQCTAHRNQSENAVHEVFLATDMIMEMMSTLNPAIIYDLQKYHHNSYQTFSQHKNTFLYNTLKTNLERGIKEELYREDINAEIIAKLKIESIFSTFNTEVFPPGKYNLVTLVQSITDIYLYGTCTPKGVRLIQKYKQQRQKQTKA
jgi:AcrR family transcriptional regulator